MRPARRLAPLLRSLLPGALAASTILATSLAGPGCADENDPETHVGKLSSPATRPAAVKRLIQFFEDAMTRDKSDRNGPTVKPLLDKIVPPLTEQCVSGDLDERTHSNLVKFLSDARDPRAEACFVKVLKEYKVDSGEEDLRWVSRAVGAMKMKAAADPLLDAFKKVRPSKPKASNIYRDVHDALLDLADPKWEGELIGLLNRPIADRKDGAVLKDEAFWQITAAEILGNLKLAGAVKPLMKTVISPAKADIAPTAVNALIKIGKPVIEPCVALLKSEDKELVDYSKGEQAKAMAGPDGKLPPQAEKTAAVAHVGAAAIILGALGRSEAAPPMIAALEKADETSRAIIARELPKLPKTAETVQAFQDAFEKTPVSATIPPGLGAREALLESVGGFYDPKLVPWLVKTALGMKGESQDVDPVKQAVLTVAMKLMTHDQVGTVDDLYNAKISEDGKSVALGKGFEKEYKIAKEMLAACTDKADCYLGKLAEPAAQQKDGQFQGIKAGYMVGVHGSPEIRQKIVDAMPKITGAAPRFVAVSIIDYFSPKGDPALAAALQKMVDAAEEAKDTNLISANAPFKTVIYRLNARAQ